MKRIKRSWALIFIASGMLLTSCVDEQNFDQYDDLRITPIVEGSILYVESPERLINSANGVDFFSQDFNFDAFAEDYVAERVLNGTVTYIIENTTSKELDVLVEFLDEGGTVLDSELFLIPPAPTALLQREVNYGTASGKSIDIIKNTSSIKVSVRNLGDNTSVSNLSDPKVILKSSGKFRVGLK